MNMNVSFKGYLDGACFMTTEVEKGNQSAQPEIILRRDDVWKFSKEMEAKGISKIEASNDGITSDQIVQYLQGLNKIMPKGVTYTPEIKKDHDYSLYNKGDMIQVWDETDDKQVVGICARSSFPD